MRARLPPPPVKVLHLINSNRPLESGIVLSYRFRLYPTKEQEFALEQTLDGCRWAYNYFLDKKMSEYDMNFALTELKEQHPWLRNYHSKMLQMVAKQVATAKKTAKRLHTSTIFPPLPTTSQATGLKGTS